MVTMVNTGTESCLKSSVLFFFFLKQVTELQLSMSAYKGDLSQSMHKNIPVVRNYTLAGSEEKASRPHGRGLSMRGDVNGSVEVGKC